MLTLDAALGIAPARVRTAHIPRDVSRACADARSWCVTAPLTPPRMWQLVTDAVGSTFEGSLGDGRGGEPALQRALGAAAQAISRLQGVLVEPSLPIDAQFSAFVSAGDVALVTVSSGMRVYRARGGEPKRLLGNAQRTPGLSRGGMAIATERLLSGDLFVFGSRDAFGMRSIGSLAALLAQRPDANVRDVCEAAIAPCRAAGAGVALVVVRVM